MRVGRTSPTAALCRRTIGALLAVVLVCWQPKLTRACLTDPNLEPASKAILSPVVFLGRFENVETRLEKGHRFYAAFRVQKVFKSNDLPKNHLRKKERVLIAFANFSGPGHAASVTNPRRVKSAPTKSFENSASSGLCASSVREFRKNDRYLVYASVAPWTGEGPQGSPRTTSLVANALPDQATSPSSRAIRKAVCKGCAKAAAVSGLSNVELEIRKKLKLQCRLTGIPAPKVEWFKDGKKLKNNKKIKIKTKKKFSRLEIEQVKPQDSGEYSCKAKNIVSKFPASVSARVTVPRIKKSHVIDDPTSWPFKGVPCKTEREKKYCMNGASCLYFTSVAEISCQCAEGFIGRRCESKDANTQGSVLLKDQTDLFVTLTVLVAFCTLTLFLVIIYAIYRKCRQLNSQEERIGLQSMKSGFENRKSSIDHAEYRTDEAESEIDVILRDYSNGALKNQPSLACGCDCHSKEKSIYSLRRPRLDAVSSYTDIDGTSTSKPEDKRTLSLELSRRDRVTRSLISSSSVDGGVEAVAKAVVKAFQGSS